MKKVLLIMMVAVMAVSMPVIAQQPTMTEWHDPVVGRYLALPLGGTCQSAANGFLPYGL